MEGRKTAQKSDSGPAVRQRLVQILRERAERDGRRLGDIRRALARTIRRAGLNWDTVAKKLRGARRLTETDVERLAAVVGENPTWLATGQGVRGVEWLRQHWAAKAARRGLSLPQQPEHPIATPQPGQPRPRGRPRATHLGPRVTGKRAVRRRGPRRFYDEFSKFPKDPVELERCLQWLARDPDILNAWIEQALLRERLDESTLRLLLDAARRSVALAGSPEAWANRTALVRELAAVLNTSPEVPHAELRPTVPGEPAAQPTGPVPSPGAERGLEEHVKNLAEDAQAMYETILKGLQEANPFRPEQWKGDRAAWLGALKRSANELAMQDLVLVPDEETEKALRDGYVD